MTEGEVLTTSQAARAIGASRQHVADLADRGIMPSWRTGSHRRFLRSDVEAFARTLATRRTLGDMTLADRRSLALGCMVAAKLVDDQDRVLAHAWKNLARLRSAHGAGPARRYVDAWERLLAGPPEDILRVLTSLDEEGVELRHTSPFAGVLTTAERSAVLAATRRPA